ncbi:GumC family protein [Aliiruegeria lutimaris]|uniref:non-specific protein-tyrosine kinase n=1 Tax=Aliiruegeria lutimaris TaxID=571298 RepID=A0A1G9HSU4_9RHOB|nr:Wzz/FepE/Etk N-terminal domain-containing protein [Aliiruegeria lutimaris]SDL16057.1 Uncharacterized protein involved in exopolysaccharide biosynthesis [Aliiruegeria lutimaris]
MNSRIMPSDLNSFARARRTPQPQDADAVDLRGLWRTIWRRRWLVIGFGMGFAILTYFAINFLVTPKYTALAKVMLDPRKAQIITNEEVVRDLDLSEEVVNGEAAVLRSNVLIQEVIETIGIERFEPMTPKTFEWVADVAAEGDPDALAYAREQQMQAVVYVIRKNLSIYREGDSYVIGIRTENPDRFLSAEIANTIADTYIGGQISGRVDKARRATSWLEARVDELRKEVEAAEIAVAEYRARSLLADGSTLETVTDQIGQLAGQLVAARADLATAEASHERLVSVASEGGFAAVARIVTSPLIEQLNAERIDLVRQDDNWAERYDANHVERVRLRAKLARIEADIEAEVQKIMEISANEFEIAQIRENTLQSGISELEERIQSITQNSLGLRQLEREAQAARSNYEMLLSRLTETRTQEQLQEPDAKLIERAVVPATPSKPRPKLLAIMAGILGGAAGLAVIFVLEMTTQTYRTGRDIESETGLPVLANLPLHPHAKSGLMEATRALRDAPYTLYAERIRHLRTALLMRDGEDMSRAIVMLSNAPGEGKTTTALALAQMSVMAGKSVIVVDGDLRRATMQKSFNWDIENDLADVLRGDCQLYEAVYTDPDFGFDFLVAKGTHPDVADRLSVRKLAPIIDELKLFYDVVIVDAPALLAVSDALVLAQVVDTRLLLVGWDSTPRRAVATGLAALNEMRLDLAGVAFSKVDPSRSSEPNIEGYSYDA